MKRLKNQHLWMPAIAVLATVLMLLCSCSDDMVTGSKVRTDNVAEAVFTFDGAVSKFANYRTFDEKMAACQIPEDLLKKLPTERLVQLCAQHPLNAICYAYDNPMTGAKYIMAHFNGFQELKSRSDAAEKLVDFYSGIDYAHVQSEPYAITLKDRNGNTYSNSGISFVELILASGEISQLTNATEAAKLTAAVDDKFEQKAANPSVFSAVSLRSSLMVRANIALESGRLNGEQAKAVSSFYECGGSLDRMGEVSRILFTGK